ncbi:MAG: DUF1232 domain-containing protein [Kiritimatiellae bacterium]|nr:DUF1232 domain-containing protein [Kiritimatiellia bacterium]
MTTDDIINTYQSKLGQPLAMETVVGEREATLKKVSDAKVLALLKDRIIAAYQVLTDVSRGTRKIPPAKLALLAGGLAYLALPLDIVCDVIPVAGLVDDGIVLTWIFAQCAELFSTDKETQAEA